MMFKVINSFYTSTVTSCIIFNLKEIVNFQLNYLILHIGSVASLERGSCVQKYDRKSDTDVQHN